MRLSGQVPSVITNLGIIAVCGLVAWLTNEGAALLGLAFLNPNQMVALPSNDQAEVEENAGNPIGFVHS